ncbi:hypothetical protein KKB40_05230 [Patescibacteria group bacterium]|nr:hypothetical protein [Patescibacteria group bacterium]
MKNWNTDASKFGSPKEKRLWELSQMINYGLDGEKLSEKELKENWEDLKALLDIGRARMLEYLIWGKIYLLPNRSKFWNLPHETK